MSASATESDSTSFRAIASASVWSDIVDRVHAIVEECRLHVSEDGIEIHSVEAGNVAMIHAEIGAGAFESWEAKTDVIGLDLNRLEDVIGLADSDELVEIVLNGKKRIFEVSGEEFDFDLAGIDPDQMRQDPDVPGLELPVSYSIAGSRLKTAADGTDMVSDHVTFETDPDEALASAFADGDIDKARFEWDEDAVESFEADCDAPVSSMVSLGYLDDVVGALDGDEMVTVTHGDDFPLILEQSFAEGAAESRYMVAPRIQSD